MLLDRRDLLRIGSVGIAASALPGVRANSAKKAKSVLVLWMAGGVTHHESFDPKPDAPEEIRGSLGTIQTGEATANCNWGNDGSVLYITADMFLCRVRTTTRGKGW